MLENPRLKSELKRLQDTKWTVAKIKDDDGMTKFFTGLPSFAVFLWLFKYDLKLGTSICLNDDKVQHFTSRYEFWIHLILSGQRWMCLKCQNYFLAKYMDVIKTFAVKKKWTN